MTIAVLSVEQVAEILGCEAARVSALAAGGHLPAVKYGRSWRFPADALARFLDEQAMSNLSRTSAVPEVRAPKSRRKPPLDFTQLVRVEHVSAVPSPKRRGKPLPDLLRAAVDAGMTLDEVLAMARPREKK
ncbi:helix-turn-helix domain-containing protein [Ralstonia syzygii]|uniref:Helix-turn-helix domain-containing protein n=1 Tax=Ralstonia syzygii TaxID=28097 RepID=A0ABX7ZE87_9RALS|nr:helix-turn-helix domain-containing protein [Ralstonia syzygii]